MFGFHDRKEYSDEGNIRTRGGLLYYEYDGLGNVMDVTDRTGSQVMSYRYDAFGDLFTQMAAPYNSNGFTGKQYDAAASLMNYSARWYSPSVGRFTTMDTYEGDVSDPQTLNRYAYTGNNPVNFIDPTGHRFFGPGGGGSDDTGSGGSSTGTGTGTGTSGGTGGSSGGGNGSGGGSHGTGSGGGTSTLAQLIAEATATFNNTAGEGASTSLGEDADRGNGEEIQSLLSGEANEYGRGNDLNLTRYGYLGGDPAVDVVLTGYSRIRRDHSYDSSNSNAVSPYLVMSLGIDPAWNQYAPPTDQQSADFLKNVTRLVRYLSPPPWFLRDFFMANIPEFGIVADGVGEVAAEGTGKIDLNVKPTVSNQKLQNTINELYRPGATTGNGSTADAIRHELETGELVGGKSHIGKGQERINNLENILRKQNLDAHDKAVAEALLQDLENALNGK